MTISLLFLFQGCNKENSDFLKTDMSALSFEQTKIGQEYKAFLSKSLNEIYKTAFDGENINEWEALKILESNKPQSIIDINIKAAYTSFPSPIFTRSNTSEGQLDKDELMKVLTKDQYRLVIKLIESEVIDEKLLTEVRKEALLIGNKEERELVTNIIDASSLIINEISAFSNNNEEHPITRSKRGETFACNVVSGVVGSCFGFVFGAISGPAAPIVGTVVTTLVGAAVSTYAC